MAKKVFLGFFTSLMMSLSFNLYAQKINFVTSSVVPAARGYAKIKKDSNKNYHVQVELWNLAEVSKLQPARQTYVIWMVVEGVTKNMGRLKSSTTLFSKKLKASFETVSALKPSRIFLSAEDDANCSYPSSENLLTTENF